MEYYDTLETRPPEVREEQLLAALPELVAHTLRLSPAYAELLDGHDPAMLNSRAALARLPVVRKTELMARQHQQPPFGGFLAAWRGSAGRVFASPGPIYEPEGRGADYWRTARALHAAGFRAGDVVHNSFSYHLTPGGWIMDAGARALGCTVVPAGVGQTEQQVRAMADLQPDGYCGTPSFLRILLDKADELGVNLSCLKKALVSGEAFLPSIRDALLSRGIAGYQAYATADLGVIAYETAAREGLMVDEGILLEIVRPGTGEPLPVGEVGEVVVTSFNRDYPLLRFGTGDLSAILPGVSPCGRTNQRIRGWLGRADQTAKVRGMFVHPSQIAEILKRHPEISRVRLVLENPDAQDRMTLHCETAVADEALRQAVIDSLRDLTKLRADVSLVAAGSLANDGKIIDDCRRLDA